MSAIFTATGGPEQITLNWSTTTEVDIDTFMLSRSSSTAGPFTPVATVSPTGPGGYQFVDQLLPGGQFFAYQLSEVLTHGASNVLATEPQWGNLGRPRDPSTSR